MQLSNQFPMSCQEVTQAVAETFEARKEAKEWEAIPSRHSREMAQNLRQGGGHLYREAWALPGNL